MPFNIEFVDVEAYMLGYQRDGKFLCHQRQLGRYFNFLIPGHIDLELPLQTGSWREAVTMRHSLLVAMVFTLELDSNSNGLPELFAQLSLARSSYFYHQARAAVEDKYVRVRQSITAPTARANSPTCGHCKLGQAMTD